MLLSSHRSGKEKKIAVHKFCNSWLLCVSYAMSTSEIKELSMKEIPNTKIALCSTSGSYHVQRCGKKHTLAYDVVAPKYMRDKSNDVGDMLKPQEHEQVS